MERKLKWQGMAPHLTDDADRDELCDGPSPKYSVTSVVGQCTKPLGRPCYSTAARSQALCSRLFICMVHLCVILLWWRAKAHDVAFVWLLFRLPVYQLPA